MGAASPLLDARGCLTEAGFRRLQRAVPGAVPEELAAHLAGCDRCQTRMLHLAEPRTGPLRASRKPSVLRTALLALGGLLLALMALILAARLLH